MKFKFHSKLWSFSLIVAKAVKPCIVAAIARCNVTSNLTSVSPNEKSRTFRPWNDTYLGRCVPVRSSPKLGVEAGLTRCFDYPKRLYDVQGWGKSTRDALYRERIVQGTSNIRHFFSGTHRSKTHRQGIHHAYPPPPPFIFVTRYKP